MKYSAPSIMIKNYKELSEYLNIALSNTGLINDQNKDLFRPLIAQFSLEVMDIANQLELRSFRNCLKNVPEKKD